MPRLAHKYLLAALALAEAFITTRPPRHAPLKSTATDADPWLTAQDGEGRTYYYHGVTMETSWTDPRVVVEAPAPEQQRLHALHVLPADADAQVLGDLLQNDAPMDETQTEGAFWSVVNEVDRAEFKDEPLSADVPRMLHRIFDADLRHLLTREQVRTNLTCMMPALTGAANAGSSMGYIMDDYAHKDLPLKEGRACEGGTCCEACSRNIFPSFMNDQECDARIFPGLNQFTFNEVEGLPSASILQFIRLIERVRRTMAHEYGLELKTLLPLQAYARKYVAGTTQQGGGGGEGDYVILHTDEATHSGYHYSSVLYLNDQGVEFAGGDFIFNDKAENGTFHIPTSEELECLTMEEELERGRKYGRSLVPFHPRKGAAVVFSSGWENMHEVYALESGTRYAVPSFFTTCPVPPQAYEQMHQGIPSTDEEIADDWLHLLLAHRPESPVESVGRVKELLMKWHYMCTPLDLH